MIYRFVGGPRDGEPYTSDQQLSEGDTVVVPVLPNLVVTDHPPSIDEIKAMTVTEFRYRVRIPAGSEIALLVPVEFTPGQALQHMLIVWGPRSE